MTQSPGDSEKPKQEEVAEEGKWKKRWQWLKQELKINKKLLPIKGIILLYNGGVMSFLPYLTLHMQQLGLAVEQIAIIYAVLPIASLLGPPIAGILADKFGKYTLVLNINITMTLIFHTLLVFVPPIPQNELSLKCDNTSHLLTWDTCDSCYEDRNNTSQELYLQNCKYDCPHPPDTVNVCLYNEHEYNSTCTTYKMHEKMTVNATLVSQVNTEVCSHTWSDLVDGQHQYEYLTCPGSCSLTCSVVGTSQCAPSGTDISSSTFWIYFALRLTGTLFLSSSFTMVDATTLAYLKEHGGEFGKQRIMVMLGLGIVPLISAAIVDWHSSTLGAIDYTPVFYLGDCLLVICIILLTRIKLNVSLPSENLLKDLKKLITKGEINVFLVMILILGSNWGFIENYLFVFLKEMHAPTYLLGLTLTVGCLVGIPMLFWADPITEKLGRTNIFLISFAAYAVRMFGYSYIPSPWYCFPFEMLEVFTFQIMWVAAATYCPILAPPGLLATMTGVAGAVHYSIGRGVGAFAGGYLIASINTRGAFRAFGISAMVGGVLYFLSHHFYLKKRIEKREKEMEEKKKEETIEEAENLLTLKMTLAAPKRPSLAGSQLSISMK